MEKQTAQNNQNLDKGKHRSRGRQLKADLESVKDKLFDDDDPDLEELASRFVDTVLVPHSKGGNTATAYACCCTVVKRKAKGTGSGHEEGVSLSVFISESQLIGNPLQAAKTLFRKMALYLGDATFDDIQVPVLDAKPCKGIQNTQHTLPKHVAARMQTQMTELVNKTAIIEAKLETVESKVVKIEALVDRLANIQLPMLIRNTDTLGKVATMMAMDYESFEAGSKTNLNTSDTAINPPDVDKTSVYP